MIIQSIDSFLSNRERDKRAIHCFHPSSLHKTPEELLKIYFEGDSNQSFPARVLRVFDNGHGVHERLQGYLEKTGILLQAEVPIQNDEYQVKGHTDGIIELNGVKGILEIKSINSSGFYSLYSPKEDHLIQVNIYMFCTGIDRGVLLYECKDNQELKEFYVKRDETILQPILDKIRTVQQMIQQKESEVCGMRKTPRVLNRHHDKWTRNAVYIGRSRKGDPPNPFGNYVAEIGKDGTREQVIEKYERWLMDQPELIKRIKRELKGKDLMCFCSPAPCHGDLLLLIANTNFWGVELKIN
jgi:hypothetical protein